MSSTAKPQLALHGGPRAISQPLPPMYPGGIQIDSAEEEAVLQVLRSKRLFRYYGPNPGESQAALLEQRFAEQFGSRYAVAVTSGTASLICGLIGLGVGPGDEVIVPAYTWIASASAVLAVGAIPVVAEVDSSLTLNPHDVERRITPRTKAMIAVHMRGAPCQMDALMAIGARHGIRVLEDVAQACGASYHGRRLGTIGDAGAFSFQFNKIITAGEGGMVLTNDQQIFHRIQMYQDVVGGQRNQIPADQILPGVNYRMTELQAAVMNAQLGKLETLLARMRANRQLIEAAIQPTLTRHQIALRSCHDPAGDAAIALILIAPRSTKANQLAKALDAEGADARVMYSPAEVDYHVYTHWEPIVHQRAWADQNPWTWHGGPYDYSPAACPQSLAILERCIHMDISPDLSSSQCEEIAEAINKVLSILG
ncbi:MAG: DegT/DnrJ/EryC1/StrS family aminotransferase [Roseiflexaceae bacterium]